MNAKKLTLEDGILHFLWSECDHSPMLIWMVPHDLIGIDHMLYAFDPERLGEAFSYNFWRIWKHGNSVSGNNMNLQVPRSELPLHQF